MLIKNREELIGGVFITFAGNCKKALTFYQSCFGGSLNFETFEEELGYKEKPVIRGTLVADRIAIHGSDLVHNEGRKIGNYISVFLSFENTEDRKTIIDKLSLGREQLLNQDQALVEITDVFEVRWVLGI